LGVGGLLLLLDVSSGFPVGAVDPAGVIGEAADDETDPFCGDNSPLLLLILMLLENGFTVAAAAGDEGVSVTVGCEDDLSADLITPCVEEVSGCCGGGVPAMTCEENETLDFVGA
jgi:hypothetical protein